MAILKSSILLWLDKSSFQLTSSNIICNFCIGDLFRKPLIVAIEEVFSFGANAIGGLADKLVICLPISVIVKFNEPYLKQFDRRIEQLVSALR